jgi:uncharacterized protein YeaO (DUF488 family)
VSKHHLTKIDIARKPITFTRCDERREVFAPSWDLLNSYKGNFISWEEYIVRYTEEMRSAYRNNKQAFVDMAKRLDRVEFVCWCSKTPTKQCHRFLLCSFLEKVRLCLKRQ